MIEIAGYRIQQLLGKGGMASVYLALQESVQREVALKVMAPTLVGEEFGERFLREARIAARLRHPHVVQVHDVGRSGDWHYIAMEHLSGGPLLRRDPPRDLPFTLRAVREIANALDYAHRRGVVHRDIKPDNILLRDDGGAVLTDFGIARASDSARMTQVGMIMGTPHYMAPEQASGEPLDGRADLYALGIVFHELLVGRVPFDADDWIAVGLMHLSAPLPQLPPALGTVQPLLDRLLAKKPADRFQSGAELAAAIEDVEDGLGAVNPGPRRRTPGAVPQVVEAAAAPAATEPHFGELGALPVGATPRPRPRRPASSPISPMARGWLFGALLAVVLVAGAAWLWRDALHEVLPKTQYASLLHDADRALAAGHLSAADGSGARQLYARVLAADPDDERATAGMRAVASGLLEQAGRHIQGDRFDAARAALAEARELGVAAAALAPLEQVLRDAEQQGVQAEQLLVDAQTALAAGHLDDGDDSAVALFRRALQATGGSEVAGAGLRETLRLMLVRADEATARGDLDAAAAQIDAVAELDATHLQLASSRAALAEARGTQAAGTATQLAQAAALVQRGRLTAPPGDNAREVYRDVLARAPGNRDALDGLRRIAEALLARAERELADFNFDAAQTLIDAARDTDPALPRLRNADQRLAERRAARSQLAGGVPLSAAQQATVQQHLQAAQQSLADGRLVHPPGESAFDRYKAALAIDPGNAAARDGIAAIPAAARTHFDQAIATGRLGAARGYVEGLETVSPSDPGLLGMKRRLASSLLGHADERLGAGELARARQAFEQASELDPSNADLPAMRARLERATP
jgi:serine/threonine-protein kinase PpkA